MAEHGFQLDQYDNSTFQFQPSTPQPPSQKKFTECLAWPTSVNGGISAAYDSTQRGCRSRQQLQKMNVREVITSAPLTVTETARNLGMKFDNELTLSAQENAVCRSSYYHLRQLRPVARSPTTDAAGTLIHASFITSRLDYCNSLCGGITNKQSVQIAAASVLTTTRRRDHISPVRRRLHWFPVRR